jgi:hypothetical protein
VSTPTPGSTPAPVSPTAGSAVAPSAGSVAASGSAAATGSGSSVPQSVSAVPTTAPPGPLGPDAVTALQGALAAEQAAVWAYGLVAGYARDPALSPAENAARLAMIAQVRSGHLLRRDATTARLVQGGAAAPEPSAAYQVSVPLTDPASAFTLAQDIETDASAAWRVVIGSTDDAELRGFALSGLSEAAVRLAMWKQTVGTAPLTLAFPGQQ